MKILTFFIALIVSGTVLPTNAMAEIVTFKCEYVDTGLQGFVFGYEEDRNRVIYGGKGTTITNVKIDDKTIAFRAVDSRNGSYADYKFDRTSRVFKMTSSDSGLEKVKVGKIYCKTQDEQKADKLKNDKPMEEAWRVYGNLKSKVASGLKDPDSAKWFPAYVTSNEVCATVNAKNGFGAYAGKRSYCAKKNSKGEWKLQN